MSDSTPPPPSATPALPSSSSSQQQQPARPASLDHAQAIPPTQEDLIAQFRFAKAPAPFAVGGKGGGAGGGGAGTSKARKSGKASGGGVSGGVGAGKETSDDEADEVVLAREANSAAQALAPQSPEATRKDAYSMADLAIPPYGQRNLNEMRLGTGSAGSPPRFSFAPRHPPHHPSSAASSSTHPFFANPSAQGPVQPAQPGSASAVAHTSGERRASTSSTKATASGKETHGNQPGPLGRIAAGLDTTPSSPASQQQQQQSLFISSNVTTALANPKKRHRTSESVESVVDRRVKSVAGGQKTPAASTSGGRKASATSAGGGGGDGQPPAVKKKKQETGVASSFEGVFGSLSKLQLEGQRKDDEIRRLRSQLADKTTEAERLLVEKTELKGDMAAQVKNAVQRANEAVEALKATASAGKAGFEQLKAELGTEADAKGLREELHSVKSELSNIFLDESFEVWLERNEETKVAILKELQTELAKRQGVIDLLRDKLETRTGELAEARDLAADAEDRFKRSASTAAALAADLDVVRRRACDEKLAAAGQLEAALVAGSEREQKHQKTMEELDEKAAAARDDFEARLAAARTVEDELRGELRDVKEALHEKELGYTAFKKHTAAHIRANCRAHEQREAVLHEQLSELRATSNSLQAERDTATSERDALTQDIGKLRAQLATPSPAAVASTAQAEEIARLRAAYDELQSANAALLADKESVLSDKRVLEESLRCSEQLLQAAFEKEKQAVDARTESFNRAARFEHDLVAAQAELLQRTAATQKLEADLKAARADDEGYKAKVKELETKVEEEKKAAVRAAIASCKEASARELMQKSNDLKRANNRYEETNKKLVKVSNELAKAKGGPVLNQHIGSSSGSDPVKPMGNGAVKPPVLPDSQAPGVTVAPSSDLTAVDSELDSAPDLDQPKTKVKSVKFATTTDPAADKAKRPGGAPVKPFVKKADGKAKRPATASKNAQERNDEEDSENTEEEDDIIDSLTPIPGAQKGRSRSSTKATYSTKKRR
ncbi:hypothetical protein JCM6882_009163 [Rhodosporidiobolus microsporus]